VCYVIVLLLSWLLTVAYDCQTDVREMYVCVLAAILLGSIKVPYMELKRRIVEVDEEKMEVAQLEQLIRYMPEPEQMSQLASLRDEYETLSEAEQFGVVVCTASYCLIIIIIVIIIIFVY